MCVQAQYSWRSARTTEAGAEDSRGCDSDRNAHAEPIKAHGIREKSDRHLFTNQVQIKCKIISGRSTTIATLDFVLTNWCSHSLRAILLVCPHVILAHLEQTNP